MSIFEKALRRKLRFQSNRGACDVENLWDLSLEELDNIYGNLSASSDMRQKSLLGKNKDENTELSIQIIEHIVTAKLEEAKAAEKAAENKALKQRILSIIAGKKEEELSGKSVEELQEMIGKL